jgi:type VI protein secretion system component VasK
MKAQHTPGPWRRLARGNEKPMREGAPRSTLPAMTVAIESASAIICVIWAGLRRDRVASAEEQEANARLIAAAPEMRELLEHALGGLITHEEDYRDSVAEIRALLARIDGE